MKSPKIAAAVWVGSAIGLVGIGVALLAAPIPFFPPVSSQILGWVCVGIGIICLFAGGRAYYIAVGQESAAEKAAATETKPLPSPEQPPPQPRLSNQPTRPISWKSRVTGVALDERTSTFNIDRGPMVAGVGIITNRGSKTKVKAQLNFYSETDLVLGGVSYVCWLGFTYREIELGHGDTVELLLFVVVGDAVQAVENRNQYTYQFHGELAFSPILSETFIVDVELFFSDMSPTVGFRYHIDATHDMPVITSRLGEFGKAIGKQN